MTIIGCRFRFGMKELGKGEREGGGRLMKILGLPLEAVPTCSRRRGGGVSKNWMTWTFALPQ